MSNPVTPAARESQSLKTFTQAVVPVVIASAAVALVLVAMRGQAIGGDEIAVGAPEAPTPYSDMHARVQRAPGPPEEQPPTF